MQDERTIGERISDGVAHFGGSWKFIIYFSIFLTIWIIFNSLPFLGYMAFDQPPFILLNLILSFIAAFQAPFIMMSQNRTEKKQDQAYRCLFHELKELVQQDLDAEEEIKELSKTMKGELEEMKKKQDVMADMLQKACQHINKE